MSLVSVLAFSLAAIIFLWCLIRGADLFSPERFYLFFHSVALGVAFLGLHEAMTSFRPLTSLIYFGSAGTFVLGVWTVKLLIGSTPRDKVPDKRLYNWNLHLWFSFGLFAIFMAGMLVAYSGAGEFPLLAEHKGKILKRFFEVQFAASAALSYGGVVAFLFFMTIFRPRTRTIFASAGFWMVIVTIGVYSLALSRSGQVFFAFAGLLFYHYAVKRLAMWKLSLAFLVFSLLIIITGYQKSYTLAERLDVEPDKVLKMAFTIPYMYLANNYWNLDYALNRTNHRPEHPKTYGFVSVSGLVDFMPLGLGAGIRDNAGFDDQFHETSIKLHGWNTISYQWALYKEYGIPGVFAGAFGLGLLLGVLYCRIQVHPTILNVAAYAFLGYFVAMSMFGYFLESSVYVYGLIYVLVCCYLCQKLVSKGGRLRENGKLVASS